MENREITVSRLMLLDLVKKLGGSNKVENVHFNFAVSKTLGRIEKEAEETRSSADLTPEMKVFYRQREQLVEELKKKEDVNMEKVMGEFMKNHSDVTASRKRQMKLYREKLRELVTISPHFIPVYGMEVNGSKREYIPQNITIEDLYNVAILLDFTGGNTDYPHVVPVSITPEMAMRTPTAVSLIGQIRAKDSNNQKEFAIGIAWNLFQLYKISFDIQTHQDYINWLEEYEVPRIDIIEKCSKKNIYGDPEHSQAGEYTINDIGLLNNSLATLEAQKEEVIAKKNTLMNTPWTINMFMVPYEWLPEEITGDQMKVMYNFIQEENK